MEQDEIEMARRSYGYGRWDAPYWFIGPEQGKGKGESKSNTRRVSEWVKLGKPELCDCLAFHRLIGDDSWHKDNPDPQTTWRTLILLLMAYKKQNTELECLKTYQRTRWGRISDGETCVIELSGIAANDLQVPVERERFLSERIEIIRQKMNTYKPELVIMYGNSKARKVHLEMLAGADFSSVGLVRRGPTTIALVPHPASFQLTDTKWISLGESLHPTSMDDGAN